MLTPIADCGLIGIIFYSSLVSFWDGLSVLNVRYVESLVALSFNTIQEYVLVMLIGKTAGGFITYRMSQKLIKNEDVEDIILNHSCSFYVHAVSDLITEMPIFYGLIIRMFFPSVLSSIALALLPLNETQFVLIQFLHAGILSWPQALLDYHPCIDRKIKFQNGVTKAIHDDHEEIIKTIIDNRMDLYRLIFLLVQIVALFFLALKVYQRNNLL